ncbi:alpha/beta fold hydrolase [Burkholderia multivorans]|uniref:Carrier domain-containing protein n=1 Tax=Burkholderia multivorans TaxID=87883 RepID=A0AB37APN9_9BURK|nr:alpha/beta fold hydrolase [Burkholderia multivorans]MBU9589637.1 alpha/beta fold hydrolase [Burkholderia multivorans]PRE39289.1 hypothetical protein C6P97_30835 [Burkholderia multivorans]PRE42290.1 hypothetical protein C6P99_24770 [Burkholderia multivorans]
MITEQHVEDSLPESRPVADATAPFIEPVTDTQKLVAGIWCELFKKERISLEDNFFTLGGHSLMAVQTLWLVQQRAGVQVPIRDLFEAHTVIGLAARIDKLRHAAETQTVAGLPNVLRLRQGTSPIRLVVVHPGGGGGTVAAYRALLDLLEGDPTIYGLSATDFDGRSIPASSVPEVAARYLAQLKVEAQDGPYCLIGWSAGGLIAYEMAQQLAEADQPPALLTLIDSKPLRRDIIREEEERFEFDQFLRFVGWVDAASPAAPAVQANETLAPGTHWLARVHESLKPSASAILSRENLSYVHDVFRSLRLGYTTYEPRPYPGEVELFVPTPHESASVEYWRSRIGSVTVTVTAGDHYSMMSLPHVQTIASVINDRLRHIIAARQDRP